MDLSKGGVMKKVLKKAILFFVITAVITFIITLFPSSASAKSYYYSDYKVDIYINEDSTVKVEEEMTLNFQGKFSYVYRGLIYKDLDYITDVFVKDEDTGEYLSEGYGVGQYSVDESSSHQKITWYIDAENEGHTFVLSYVMHGVIGYQKNWDELYYNAIFYDREVLVENVLVNVYLPKETDGEIKTALYADSEISNHETVDKKTAKFTGTSLPPYSNFTIVVGWPKGIVEYHLNRTKTFQIVGIFIAVLSIITVLVLWYAKGKDAPGRGTIAPEFAPPDPKLPVGLVGLVLDERANVRELTATILSLAQRGYLRIEEYEDKGLFGKKKRYKFIKKKDGKTLKSFEKVLFNALFTMGDEVTTKDLENKFYVHLDEIYKKIYEDGTKKSFFPKNPQKVRNLYLGCSIALVIFLVVVTIILSGIYKGLSWIPGGFIFGGVLMTILSNFMSRKTKLGAVESEKWKGFKLFLSKTDRFGFGDIDEQLFAKYLPYATVMGVEKEWAERFSALKIEPPDWYRGTGYGTGFNSVVFASSIGSMNSSTGGAMSTTPGGSGVGGGSGFGGGGGGGGAGGGGGGAG